MAWEHLMASDYDKREVESLNNKLLQKRALLRGAELEAHGHELETIRQHLVQNEHAQARIIALSLQDSLIYRDAVRLFKNYPETFRCTVCGLSMHGIVLREDTLSWIWQRVCDHCGEEEEAKERDRQKIAYKNFVDRNMKNILTSIGVEEKLFGASYNGYAQEIVHACRRVAAAKHGIYVWGDTGTGKTWLTVALIKELMCDPLHIARIKSSPVRNYDDFHYMFRLAYVPWLLTILRDSYESKQNGSEKELIALYSSIPVLIFDDIGTEKPSEWVREKLNMIVYFRSGRGLRTMYTSNHSPDTLAQTLDKRITSRIFQDCEIIHLMGPDRRRKLS